MKNLLVYTFSIVLTFTMLQACGQDDEMSAEQQQEQEQAMEDSLEQAYQEEQEQMRRDSLEQARADSIAAAEEERRIEYSEDGDFTVQVEAWRSQEKAELQADKWEERGYDQASVVTYGNPETGNVWYRIRIGQVETREMAEKLQNKLLEDHETQTWISLLDLPDEQE